MQNMKDIKRRIDSVENTQKITRAMKMVAAAKLKNSQNRAEAARPFFKKTRQILGDISRYTREEEDHPLMARRQGGKSLYIGISGDRGLCGAYNTRVIKKIETSITDKDQENIVAIGSKVRDYFRKRDYNIISEYVEIADYPGFKFARRVGEEVISLFKEQIVDRVFLVYTHFNSAISQDTKKIPLLPVEMPEDYEGREQVDFIYEPSAREVLNNILPRYINNILYASLLEAKASEFGSRMTAMDSATDNAEEMIEDLTLTYNRARQAQITKEITEIVGGAEALK